LLMVLALAGDSTITTFIQEIPLSGRRRGLDRHRPFDRGIWRRLGRLSNSGGRGAAATLRRAAIDRR
jgi:hypothetical protein